MEPMEEKHLWEQPALIPGEIHGHEGQEGLLPPPSSAEPNTAPAEQNAPASPQENPVFLVPLL